MIQAMNAIQKKMSEMTTTVSDIAQADLEFIYNKENKIKIWGKNSLSFFLRSNYYYFFCVCNEKKRAIETSFWNGFTKLKKKVYMSFWKVNIFSRCNFALIEFCVVNNFCSAWYIHLTTPLVIGAVNEGLTNTQYGGNIFIS